MKSEEQKQKRMKRNEESVRNIQDTIKKNNTYFTSPRRRIEVKGEENLVKEKMGENFPNLGRDLDIQVHIGNIAHLKISIQNDLQKTHNKSS